MTTRRDLFKGVAGLAVAAAMPAIPKANEEAKPAAVSYCSTGTIADDSGKSEDFQTVSSINSRARYRLVKV